MARHGWMRAGAAIALLAGFACTDSTGPGVEPEIRNNPDTFEFQTSKLSGYTKTLTYSWTNTGTQANVNQASSVTGGSARLEIRDTAGQEVYARSLSDNGTFVTSAGQAGTWTIRVVLTETGGTLNFRAQKRT